MGLCKVNGNFFGIFIMGSCGYEKKFILVILCIDLNVYYFNFFVEEFGMFECFDLVMF